MTAEKTRAQLIEDAARKLVNSTGELHSMPFCIDEAFPKFHKALTALEKLLEVR